MREIGASWTRSLRPKISELRRSLRKVKCWLVRLHAALEEVLGDRPHALGRVLRLARRVDRVLVDVGGVDLHALAERLLAHVPHEQHGDRVGLLAGRAPGRPDAQLALLSDAVERLGQDVLVEVLPRRRVAEEAGDVDEDRVEELGELVGVDLEVVEVVAVAADLDALHALAEAAFQARALVAAEVEAAGALEELQQLRQIAVVLWVLVAHDSASSGEAPTSVARGSTPARTISA